MRNDDFVECNCCRKRITRKMVSAHYITYIDGKTGYPAHRGFRGIRYSELEDPRDDESKVIPRKMKGIGLMFASKNDNDNNNVPPTPPQILCAPKKGRKHSQHPRTAPFISIKDMFQRISVECMESDKLGFDIKYFVKEMNKLLSQMECIQNEIDIDQLIEKESLEYYSIFNLLNEISSTMSSSSNFLKKLNGVIQKQQMDCYHFSDLLLKFYFNGARLTEHSECKTGEALTYCTICCDDPKYPVNNKQGDVVHGLPVDINNIHKNSKQWKSLKVSYYKHYIKSSTHWDNCNGLKKHKKDALTAQTNQFLEVLRMCNGNIADKQYPLNCLKNHRIAPGSMGNIGLSEKAPKKLR